MAEPNDAVFFIIELRADQIAFLAKVESRIFQLSQVGFLQVASVNSYYRKKSATNTVDS